MSRYSRINPFWVTPGGKAGYLSPDEEEGVAGVRFGGHTRYKKKHPTRGPVPSFIEREARMEMPPEPLAPGWSTRIEVIDHPAGQTVKYHLLFQGRETGKYALDPSKAASLSQRLEYRDGKWRKRKPGWMSKARGNPAKDYRTYMAEKKAQGWSHKKALAGWRRIKAREESKKAALKAEREAGWAAKRARKADEKLRRNVMTLAFDEIYDLADQVLGHSEFIHSTGMFDWDNENRIIVAELYSPKWSNWFPDKKKLTRFVAGLKQIQKKYKPHLKMTVAVKNPRIF